MGKATSKKPTGVLSHLEALVLAFLWLNPGSTVSAVRENAPCETPLAVLRKLKARGYARKARRHWGPTRMAGELMAIGTRLQREGLEAFRTPKVPTAWELLPRSRKGGR